MIRLAGVTTAELKADPDDVIIPRVRGVGGGPEPSDLSLAPEASMSQAGPALGGPASRLACPRP